MSVDTTAAIAVRDLTVRYGRRVAVDGASLTVPKGAVYALLGRNGAGKSSLIRCLLGLQKPARGEVSLLGGDPWRERLALLARVGVVPETPDAPPELSAEDLSALCARLHGRWDAAAVADRLRRFAVPTRTAFQQLSKGEKGAVMLALALGHEPELLVLDDPTLGLDVVARNEVFGEVIGELADRGTTVFLTTHDLRGIEGLADRVGILAGGRLEVEEDMETLKARWGRPLEDIFVAVVTGEKGAA